MNYFNQNSNNYDAYAGVQRVFAHHLMNYSSLSQPDSILDLGCGTGNLTQILHERYPIATITAIDSAKNMLSLVKKKISSPLFLKEIKIENFQPLQKYDLIISNLAFQWLEKPIEEIKRYQKFLNSKGLLLINLLSSKTFANLQQSYKICQIPYRGLKFLTDTQIRQNIDSSYQLISQEVIDYCSSTQQFYRNLHKLGAFPQKNQIPIHQFRKLIHYHNQQKKALIPFNYEAYIIIFEKK